MFELNDCMLLYALRVLALVIIAGLYAIFDIFNQREVPDKFVYAALGIGILLTLTYPLAIAEESALIAIAIAALGYVVYKAGYWGAGDFMELTTLSLIMPIQPKPLLSSINQYGLPFILSIFISAGIIAIWAVPIYYLVFNKRKTEVTSTQKVYKALGVVLFALYLLLIAFLYLLSGLNLLKAIILLAIGIPSTITLAYEEEIAGKMISWALPKELDEGDIIAINFMSRRDIDYFTKRYKPFGRLVTKEEKERIKGIRKRLPVYKHAVPFTVFVLAGLLVSLLFGDIILYLL